MKRFATLLTVASLLLLATGPSRYDKLAQPPSYLEPFVSGNTTFAFDLHRHLTQPGSNLIFSPYSLTAALALAQSGARGSTEQQIASSLHFPAQSELRSALAGIRTSFTEAGEQKQVELVTATGLWAQQDYGFGSDFLQRARETFKAEVQLVDFRSRYDATSGEINSWASRQTRGKIPEALLPGMLGADTRLVFVNTLYFKGQWASCFQRNHTRKRSFQVSPAQSVKVPMMRQSQFARYAESETAQVVELPYVGGRLSMVVVLPRAADGLPALEQQLSWNQVANWAATAQVRTVDLELPRFKLSSRLPLIQPMRGLGVTDAFDPVKADFTGMSTNRPLWIYFLHQCAIVEVNEEGTVAAAATSGGGGCSSQPRPATFHADHPFLFFIRDNQTGVILFLGRVMNPAQS
jgi:serine protease inhibitor